MTTATLKWTDPLPAAEIASIDLYDEVSTVPGKQKIGSVAGGVQIFVTGDLVDGEHTFSAIVNGINGHASSPSNSVTVTVSSAVPAITDLSVTLNP